MSLEVRHPPSGQSIVIPVDARLRTVPASAFAALRLPATTPLLPQQTVPLRLYDPGLRNTVVCRSAIVRSDAVEGKIYYRGIDLENLVQGSSFLEVAYLLIHGQLPTQLEREAWVDGVMHHTYLHTEIEKQMATFRYDAHPMGMFIATVSSLSTCYPEANPALAGAGIYAIPKPVDSSSPEFRNVVHLRNKQVFRLLGKLPTIAANTLSHRSGRAFNHPKKTLDYAENFLYMLDKLNEEDGWSPDPRLVKIFDKLLILGAGA